VIGFEFLASVAPILAFGGLRRIRVAERICTANLQTGSEILPDVRIWYVPHGPEAAGALRSATLTPEDVAEFASLRNRSARDRSLSTRSVLRHALTEMAGGSIAPEAWVFHRDDLGKPMLAAGLPKLSFSCSHTEAMSIIAISARKSVGVDIEIADFAVTGQWMDDTFTITERAIVNALPRTDRQSAIARLWTLKEAYLKMLGTGIADALEVAFDPRDDRLLSGHLGGPARPGFKTWVSICQGQPLSVAVATSDPTKKGAFWRRYNEGYLVRLRAIFGFFGQRADQGSSLVASLFRSASAAAAGSSGG
jgi:4'-phosphopantetheinyl transferase